VTVCNGEFVPDKAGVYLSALPLTSITGFEFLAQPGSFCPKRQLVIGLIAIAALTLVHRANYTEWQVEEQQ